MNIREAFKVLMKTKSFWVFSVIGFLELAAIIIFSLVSLQVTNVNIPVHYSSYADIFFSDKWYYMIAFIVFAVVVFAAHLGIAAKMVTSEKRKLAQPVQLIGDIMLLITLMIILNLFNIVRLRLQL
jgi:hypothetical protein